MRTTEQIEEAAERRARRRVHLPDDLSPSMERAFTDDELNFWRRRCQDHGAEFRRDLRALRAGFIVRMAGLTPREEE